MTHEVNHPWVLAGANMSPFLLVTLLRIDISLELPFDMPALHLVFWPFAQISEIELELPLLLRGKARVVRISHSVELPFAKYNLAYLV